MLFKSGLEIILIFALVHNSLQDIYLHNPRGSNNRLNERTAARNLLEITLNKVKSIEKNNARGGYNVGDATSQAATNEQQQYQMRYFQSGSLGGKSILEIEWTNQHGCGGDGGNDDEPTKQNCQLILQYMCQPKTDYSSDDLDRIRDGTTTQSQGYTNLPANTDEDPTGFANRRQGDVKTNLGLHETWQYYDSCVNRQRNLGLFTADQSLRKNQRGYSGAIYTRQNPNGNRNGYECPEERDYWPYWHPSPWKDIGILTNNASSCTYYSSESFNVKPKNLCVEYYNTTSVQKTWSRWNNEAECLKNGGFWLSMYNYLEKAPQYKDEKSCLSQSSSLLTYIWAVPYDSISIKQKECLVQLPAPVCKQADLTRSNHLGNTLDGHAPRFQWQLPYFPSRRAQTCLFRIRYNISTDDFDPYSTNASFNGNQSPIQNNPDVDIGANMQVLQLAIDTNQYGRVFQDRSHSFLLLARPSLIGDSVNIQNLNIRGKRGNIVQVYPAVEYDFVPTNLSVKSNNDLVHIQWTGSNSHQNGGNEAEGQTGDDGQGNTGTDRNNLVQISDLNENFPLPFEIASLWSDVDLVAFVNSINFTDDSSTYLTSKQSLKSDDFGKDLALYLSSSGYYSCVKTSTCGSTSSYEGLTANSPLDADLNTAPASLPGALIRFTKSNKSYYFMCSRNNNFSNRSQKGAFIVV